MTRAPAHGQKCASLSAMDSPTVIRYVQCGFLFLPLVMGVDSRPPTDLSARAELSRSCMDLSSQDHGAIAMGAQMFGAQLLSACDADDFRDRLDALLEQHSFYDVNNAVRRVHLLELETVPTPDPLDARQLEGALELVVGPEATPLLLEGFTQSARLVAALYGVLRSHPAMAEQGEAAHRGKEPLWFLGDPGVAPELARRLLGALQADACGYALAAAFQRGERLPSWLAEEIGKTLLNGTRGYLALLASIPQTNIPISQVPTDERLDIPSLDRQQAAVRLAYATLGAYAARHPSPVVGFTSEELPS